MKQLLGTKAETLENLSPIIKTASILPQIRFTSKEWKTDAAKILKTIEEKDWFNCPLIVRSSALSEDNAEQSLAGHFLSLMNIEGQAAIQTAIEQVIQSLPVDHEAHQVFIQPMLKDVVLSGVVFTQDPNTAGPYIVINYDAKSHQTDTVTSGQTNNLQTFYQSKVTDIEAPSPLNQVIALANELEDVLKLEALDIEFAITQQQLYLLQVRPLIVHDIQTFSTQDYESALKQIANKIRITNQPHPYLYGSRTVYGVMPDWNPAEIIGIRPNPLALSLYQELVTDTTWAYQRDNYGYKNLRSFPLLFSFHGMPYIDVRVSFNSFIPANLEDEIAERIVNYYLERLVESPGFHDKVEFEIIFSCYTLDLPERLNILKEFGFSEEDCQLFAESLRSLTNGIIHGQKGLWKKDIAKIEKLSQRQQTILSSELDKISQIYWLLEDCKRYGTLPFAGLARAGFIAVQLLRSLVSLNILSTQEYQNFMGTLDTVSSRMGVDFENLSQKAFLKKYGHLRPGTYDILSPRYDETPENYFNWSQQKNNHGEETQPFVLSLAQLKQIETLLKEHQLEHDILGLFDFIKEAIEGREYAKFIFTKSLSDALQLFKELILENGFSVEESAFAHIDCIKTLYTSSSNIKQVLETSIRAGQYQYALTQHLTLPPLIVDWKDVYSFHLPQFEPNFITLKKTIGNVSFIEQPHNELKDSILMIPHADPGYDWIFSHQISGFITMYGGINSHMAIRANELGIPAVIGAGELLYNQWSKANLLELDCSNHQVKVLQ